MQVLNQVFLEKVKGYLAAIISNISYGLIPLFIIPVKQASFSMDVTLTYRFSLAALMALLIVLLKKEKLKVDKRELFLLFTLGMDYALSNELLFLGYDLTSPAIASTLLFIYPVIVALIALFVFKEKLKTLTYIALIVALGGVYLLTMGDSTFAVNFPGLFVALGAALFYALFIITVNRGNLKSSTWTISFYSLLFAALYYLVKSGIRGESLILPEIGTFFYFVLFALITTVISNVGLIYAAKKIGDLPTSIMGALEPVVAVLVSVLVFFEALTWKITIGIILIIIGVILNMLTRRCKNQKQIQV